MSLQCVLSPNCQQSAEFLAVYDTRVLTKLRFTVGGENWLFLGYMAVLCDVKAEATTQVMWMIMAGILLDCLG